LVVKVVVIGVVVVVVVTAVVVVAVVAVVAVVVAAVIVVTSIPIHPPISSGMEMRAFLRTSRCWRLMSFPMAGGRVVSLLLARLSISSLAAQWISSCEKTRRRRRRRSGRRGGGVRGRGVWWL